MRTTSQSITAPEINRIAVKLAASMPVCLRATRQSSELPANAIMASDVRAIMRAYDIERDPEDHQAAATQGAQRDAVRAGPHNGDSLLCTQWLACCHVLASISGVQFPIIFSLCIP
jgi:hypothetical protein